MATMMPPTSTFQAAVNEFREEAAITKRLLDRLPGDKLAWTPHQKSMSLGAIGVARGYRAR